MGVKVTAQKSPYVVVRESSIHMRGVYAKTDIPKGARVIQYVGEKITKAESDKRADSHMEKSKNHTEDGGVYIFELNSRYDIDGNKSWNIARYINHSCRPNCETDIIAGKIWIIAKKNIKQGDELVYDYGYDIENYEDHPCWCGSEDCVGYIVAQDHLPKLYRKIGARNRKHAAELIKKKRSTKKTAKKSSTKKVKKKTKKKTEVSKKVVGKKKTVKRKTSNKKKR